MSNPAFRRDAQQSRLSRIGGLPPLVYFILGLVCLAFWLAGTAVEVQTSEAWISNNALNAQATINVFAQFRDFIVGSLPTPQIVPFTFAWGVQLALISASAGLELPRYPVWRHRAAWGIIILLIGVNSAGDWTYSSVFGGWAALGFTVVVLFVTFVLGLLAVMCFVHGWRVMTAGNGREE